MTRSCRKVRGPLVALVIAAAMLASAASAGAATTSPSAPTTSSAVAALPPCLHNPVTGQPVRCGLTAMVYYYGVGIVVTRVACALETGHQRAICGTPAGYCVYNVFTGQPLYCEHQTKVIPALTAFSQMLVECARDPQC
jgi:hypothetical protein